MKSYKQENGAEQQASPGLEVTRPGWMTFIDLLLTPKPPKESPPKLITRMVTKIAVFVVFHG